LRQGEKLQALGQLTGGVAHDFNNIIQVLAAGAELLKRPDLGEEKRALILDSFGRATQNAKRLVERLLAFARRQPLRPEVFQCTERLSNFADMLRRALGSVVNLQVDFASNVWPVFVDPSQLEVAVLNLALNARDAISKKGNGVVTLRTYNTHLSSTAERPPGDYVCIEVQDTGEGMTADVLSHIFEPFFTTKETGHGTGLGLPQVHGFVKQSGGDIEVKSTYGIGTVISIYLPRAEVAPSNKDNISHTARVAAGGSATDKLVLVVDDNPDVVSVTTALLEHLGYKTCCAKSAAEALEILRMGETVVDAVLSDIAMSGMNGIELTSVLRLRYPGLPVVLATGYSEMLTRWSDEMPTEILRKPYGPEELTAALEHVIGHTDS
jgi:CheY-like chemotaxis protein